MNDILVVGGILVAVWAALALVRLLFRTMLAALVGRAIGDHALAGQPDAIHLHKAGPEAWRDPAAVRPALAQLAQRGFHDSGVFTVTEMPGVVVQLLVRSDEGLVAVLYEHPTAGHWMDLAVRHQDGSSVTYTTAPPSGLAERPGHAIHNLPGLDASTLYARFHQEVPRRPVAAVTPFTAPRVFEHAYAEATAWRKQRGITAGEVATVASNMKDAA